jgi:hypothetical protein
MLDSRKYLVKSGRTYEFLRKNFSENSPCKLDFVKSKIKSSLRVTRLNNGWNIIYCACGCGLESGLSNSKNTIVKYIDGHKEYNKCACGCGTTVKKGKWASSCVDKKVKCACGCGQDTYKRFNVSDPNIKIYVTGHDPQLGKKLSLSIKDHLNQLSYDQMSERMNKSLYSCDHEKRVQSIREGKSSEFELIKKNGEKIKFFSYDDVLSLTGFTYDHIKYRLKRYDGLLLNGDKVICTKKYVTRSKNI